MIGQEPRAWWQWPGRRAAALGCVALIVSGLLWANGAQTGSYLVAFIVLAVVAALWPVFIAVLPSPRELAAPRRSVDSAALLSALIARLPVAAILLDSDGRVADMNPAAAKLAPALRQGEPALFALRTPEIVSTLRQAIATSSQHRAEYVERVPLERWLEVVVTPLGLGHHAPGKNAGKGAAAGNGQFMLITFNDLTPLRRVEELRADFVANASHELRTPLAAISGFIDTLQGPARNDTPARERFLSIMHVQASRMARLIDDLLSLSRIELSEHVTPEKPVDVVSIVRQVADGLESLARERGVEMRIEASNEIPDAPGDRDELFRLFENLMENALKYGASGGKVEVHVTQSQTTDGAPEIRVAVRDFGPGIAPEHLPRLTERFYRVDVGESRMQGGTGLGLSLVKHILKKHRGRLLVESSPGEGATFTACLPVNSAS